jgi:hypothetical protein
MDAMTVRSGICLAVAIQLAACTGGPETPDEATPPTTASGHARMVAELARVAEQAARDNPYLGGDRVSELQGQLAELPPSAPAARRTWLLSTLGLEELRVGQTDDAIERFNEALAVAEGLDDTRRDSSARLITYYLGVAFMRRGETDNCVARHTSDSCILPIRGGGVHVDQAGSREAIAHFLQVLEASPPESAIRQVIVNRGFLSASDARVHFGLGAAERADISVVWPSGTRQTWSGVPADSWVRLAEGRSQAEIREAREFP